MIVTAAVFFVLVVAWIVAEGMASRRRQAERRDWPARVKKDYELERVRDHFFEHLTPEDVEWMVAQGWRPPEDVARSWKEVSRFRRLSTMTPAEMDAYLKARAAGIHLTAHPDDLRFP